MYIPCKRYYLYANLLYVNDCDLGFEEEIIKQLMEFPEVKEVRGVYGVYGIFAKIETENMERHKEIVARIRAIDKIRTTNTLIVIEEQGGR